MKSILQEFQLELALAVLERNFLTSKRDMLGGQNKEGERLKTMIATLLAEIIDKWYMTVFTEDNFCEEVDIQIALETFNAICKTEVWYGTDLQYDIAQSSAASYVWDDSGYWNDMALWMEG